MIAYPLIINIKKSDTIRTMKKITLSLLALALSSTISFAQRTKIAITTEYGKIVMELYDNTPKHRDNMVKLTKEHFFDSTLFHRVIPGFVIQGGDPTGTGAGGPGYQIDCELDGENQYHDRGVLSMAHAGRNTGGSQFFICHSRNNTSHLDRNHTCFGKVIENVDVVDDIRQGDKILGIEVTEE